MKNTFTFILSHKVFHQWQPALPVLVFCACVSLPSGLLAALPVTVEAHIQKKSDAIFDEMVRVRRDIHSHPELSGNEIRTAKLVANQLRSLGLEVRTGVGGHGVIGILHGKKASPVVAYRADMDAFQGKLNEKAPYKSTVPDAVHGCGHDAHTVIGLGIAHVLSSLRHRLPGTVVFLFQPAEEVLNGASEMIKAGALENPKPDVIFALHMMPFKTGAIVITPGTGLTAKEYMEVQMSGKTPEALAVAAKELADFHRGSDNSNHWLTFNLDKVNLMTAAMLDKDSTRLSNNVNTEVSVSQTSEGVSVLAGLGTAKEEDFQRVKVAFLAKVKEIENRGFTCKLKVKFCFPAVKSNPSLATWAMGPLTDVIGKTSVLRAYHNLPFGCDDYSFFLQKIPGVFFWLGGGDGKKGADNPEGAFAMIHSPDFVLAERAIAAGIKGMSNVLFQYLATPQT